MEPKGSNLNKTKSNNWNNGLCNRFDLEFELRKIEDDLISKYGQVSVF